MLFSLRITKFRPVRDGRDRGIRLIAAPSRQCAEQFYEARLIRITDGGFAIWLDPFGVLESQVVVNLLLGARYRCGFGHAHSARCKVQVWRAMRYLTYLVDGRALFRDEQTS